MAKAKDERPPDTRPPVTTGPGGMAPPPGSLGAELEAGQKDARPPVVEGGTGAGVADGQGVKPPPQTPPQPTRPDQTTQGQRPNVGGSNPTQSHPDNPAMTGPGNVAPHAMPQEFPEGAGGDDEGLSDAQKRAAEKGGNVYRVTKTLTTGHVGHVTESDFVNPDGSMRADIPWLVKQGALTPVGELKADPNMARQLGKQGQEEIDRLQVRINELSAENDRLTDELAKAKAEITRLRGLNTKPS